ncbi:unannotated protein [freshwater metagenome]|uniref:Unannotated protein n=1 Tax=freshwater metagenome TaxID=449393 RepID=A0A6J7RKH5_9ZZZZ
MATPYGPAPAPAEIVATTVFEAVDMTFTVFELKSATYTLRLSGVTASILGALNPVIVAATVLFEVRITETELSAVFETYT